MGALAGALLVAAQVALFQTVLDDAVQADEVPGVAVSVVQKERVVFSGGSGFADIELAIPMRSDTRMYSGSLSKIFTAGLVLRFVDAGQLTLDEEILEGALNRPGATVPITVQHLLTHSSGLPREGDSGYWFNANFPGAVALSEFLANTELKSEPGVDVSYSNIGYAALGLEIEQISKLSFHAALHEFLLAPLELINTGSPGPIDGIARGYTPPGRLIPSAERPFAGVGKRIGERYLREYHDAAAMTPAFGVYTTADDLGRYLTFLLGYAGDDLLSADLRIRLLTREQGRRSLGLGTGRLNGRDVARHSGWFAAHRSYVLIDLKAEIGVAVLANGDNARPRDLAEMLLQVALDGGVSSD